jgi:hypothetical protein
LREREAAVTIPDMLAGFRLSILAANLLLGVHSLPPSWAETPHPLPGEEFQIHQETVVDGTYTLGHMKGRMHQVFEAEFSALILPNATPADSWRVDYRYDHLRFESRINDSSGTSVELWPDRMVIGSETIHDRELHPDTPTPILCEILLAPLSAVFGPGSAGLRFEERKSLEASFPFLDLVQPVRETWMRYPPEPLKVGMNWSEDRTIRVFGDRVILPASQTYTLESLPPAPDQPLVLSIKSALQSSKVRRYPIPIGFGALPLLRFDALGPDLNAPPPDIRIKTFAISSKGEVEYRLDWHFLSRKETHDWISIVMEVPRPDGLEMDPKELRLDRVTKTTVIHRPPPPISEEARSIWIGG